MLVTKFNNKSTNLGGRLVNRFYFGPLMNHRVAAFHVNKKNRNLFFTLTDLTGSVLGSSSAGAFVTRRKKRMSVQVVEMIVKKLVAVVKAYRVESVRLFFKFHNRLFAVAVARTLRVYGVKVVFVADLIPLAHNGCRKKKKRRL